jgi:hypothetical protein
VVHSPCLAAVRRWLPPTQAKYLVHERMTTLPAGMKKPLVISKKIDAI